MKHDEDIANLRAGRVVVAPSWKRANLVQRAALSRGLRVPLARIGGSWQYQLTLKGIIK